MFETKGEELIIENGKQVNRNQATAYLNMTSYDDNQDGTILV
ncbi:hypothetical protein [Niallia endozanthoxylica]|nr:hypothetical protein [Niallia endozanthoxylica]